MKRILKITGKMILDFGLQISDLEDSPKIRNRKSQIGNLISKPILFKKILWHK